MKRAIRILKCGSITLVRIVLLLLFLVFFLICFCLHIFSLRFPITASIPFGLYREINRRPSAGYYGETFLEEKMVSHALKRGYIVKSGGHEIKIMAIMKPIVGMPGDRVSIKDGLLSINDVSLPAYPILTCDSEGRPVQRFSVDEYTIPPDKYLLLSDYKMNSWDGRYWGPVSVEHILEPYLLFQR